jgi:biopolymer transport protein ExbD
MAGGTSQRGNEPITAINVTPLVDVMLVLLVIFMVTATYIVNQSIKVELPKAATGDEGPSTNLAFVVDKDSGLFLNGKPVTFEELTGKIQEFRAKGTPLQALISADKQTPHGTVVKLIDVVRRNGVFDFAINVEADDTPVGATKGL